LSWPRAAAHTVATGHRRARSGRAAQTARASAALHGRWQRKKGQTALPCFCHSDGSAPFPDVTTNGDPHDRTRCQRDCADAHYRGGRGDCVRDGVV
jgi:hypothetical protein